MSIDFDAPSADAGDDTGESEEATDLEGEIADTEAPDLEPEAADDADPDADPDAEPPPEEPEPEPEPDPDSVTHKVKIDGKEMDVSLAELKRIASHKLTAEQRFREAAKVRKESEAEATKAREELETIKSQATELIQFLRSDPEQGLIQLGLDPYKFAQHLGKKMASFQKMTPEQRKLYQERQQLQQEQREWKRQQEQSKRQQEEAKKRAEAEAIERQQQQARTQFVDKVHDQLDALGFSEGEQERVEVLSRAAGIARRNLADGVKMPLDMVVKKAVDDITGYRSQVSERYLKSLPPEKLLEMVGPDRVREIRAKEARESARAPARAPKPRQPRRQQQKTKFFETIEDIFD